jgi:hypothetical protein
MYIQLLCMYLYVVCMWIEKGAGAGCWFLLRLASFPDVLSLLPSSYNIILSAFSHTFLQVRVRGIGWRGIPLRVCHMQAPIPNLLTKHSEQNPNFPFLTFLDDAMNFNFSWSFKPKLRFSMSLWFGDFRIFKGHS